MVLVQMFLGGGPFSVQPWHKHSAWYNYWDVTVKVKNSQPTKNIQLTALCA